MNNNHNHTKMDALSNNLDEDKIRSIYAHSNDVTIATFPFQQCGLGSILMIYCNGMVDAHILSQQVLPDLQNILEISETEEMFVHELEKTLKWSRMHLQTQFEIDQLLFMGHALLYYPLQECFYSANISNVPHRNPEESNSEISVKGSRDGFTEELQMNVALIRKRLRTSSLHNEQFIIGKRSQTKVSLLYMADITRQEIVEEARGRLNGIHVDALVSSGQLEDGISDSSYSLFPLLDYIGRPDYAVECLMRGRFIILVEGSPTAIIGPCNLTEMLKTPEDVYLPYHFVAFQRLLRFIGLFLSIFLPGFWIALTAYDVDQLPFPLLATVAMSRTGLPFSTAIEVFLMMILFELFREAGIRLPKAVGQTIAVVGGLIVGESAIRAGLTSPTILVITATTAVATFTLVNQSLSGTVSLFRIYVLVWASLLGMFGFFISLMSIVAYLSMLESFGVSYLAPVSPLTWKDLVPAFLARPFIALKRRPQMLNTKDSTREGSDY